MPSPVDFTVYTRYNPELRDFTPRASQPAPLSFAEVDAFLARRSGGDGLAWTPSRP